MILWESAGLWVMHFDWLAKYVPSCVLSLDLFLDDPKLGHGILCALYCPHPSTFRPIDFLGTTPDRIVRNLQLNTPVSTWTSPLSVGEM